jgi:hypothetical protein
VNAESPHDAKTTTSESLDPIVDTYIRQYSGSAFAEKSSGIWPIVHARRMSLELW